VPWTLLKASLKAAVELFFGAGLRPLRINCEIVGILFPYPTRAATIALRALHSLLSSARRKYLANICGAALGCARKTPRQNRPDEGRPRKL
jgi:hypothetical protein